MPPPDAALKNKGYLGTVVVNLHVWFWLSSIHRTTENVARTFLTDSLDVCVVSSLSHPRPRLYHAQDASTPANSIISDGILNPAALRKLQEPKRGEISRQTTVQVLHRTKSTDANSSWTSVISST